MKFTGLITGASSGIGRQLAYEHARRGRDLVIVARREGELNELARALTDRYGVTVKVIAKDLTGPNSRREIFEQTEREGIQIDYLFNNAGFGGLGTFHEQDWGKLSGMIELNIVALTELLHLYLPGMVARNRGRVLNTSSTAGFIPGPGQAVYFATKAYVTSLSKGVAGEIDNTNVTVTALCPGAVKTEFADTAGFEEGSNLMKNAATPHSVAVQGYSAMEAGRLEVINELPLAFMTKVVAPLLPDRAVMGIVKKLQG